MNHGAVGYKKGCRCYRCTDGHRVRLRKYRDQCSVRRLAGEMPVHLHGTKTGYNMWNCRCAPCTEAIRLHGVRRKANKGLPKPPRRPHMVPIVGIHKDTGAVVILTGATAAAQVGWNPETISSHLHKRRRHRSAYGYRWRHEDPENPTTHWTDADGVVRQAMIIA